MEELLKRERLLAALLYALAVLAIYAGVVFFGDTLLATSKGSRHHHTTVIDEIPNRGYDKKT